VPHGALGTWAEEWTGNPNEHGQVTASRPAQTAWAGLKLQGPRRREEASEARVKGGRWASVLMEVEGLADPGGLRAPGRVQDRTVTLVRATVPLK
jgi:hypothetical protein